MSNIIHKAKDTMSGDKHTTGTTSTTAGPHSSNMANKADPRVDSDLDGSRNAGVRRTDNYGATTAGPHSSNIANKVDPRVDSDLDGSRNAGLRGGTAPTGATHAGTTTHGYGSTNAGPHSSNLANKADPRVDSDLDNRGTTGTTGAYGSRHTAGSTGLTGTGTGTHGTHGTHSTGTHVPGTHTTGTHTTGTHVPGTHTTGTHTTGTHPTGTHATHVASSTTGPAPNTAGPHKSDLLNKLDPRVDSNLDGSKTLGNKQTQTGTQGHY